MSNVSIQKKLAAKILGVGVSRIYVAPEHLADVSQAITKDDVRSLIKTGLIDIRPPSTPTRGRKRLVRIKKAKGKRKAAGSRKGGMGVRRQPEREWVLRVRKQRQYLRKLRADGVIDAKTYRALYLKIKGGVFTSLASLKNYIGK
ncbi:50S ribosomal protein L19e [Candidatus Marsarchaeota G2 archaeon BE_D]|jgi:large subunit ribosomal protein L19e|uniref:Large ribosomal subunit protein eL19 n=1 Tax=Candidatus Marsarchaeota G2 archaeon BE_D TaxID=1978158 RepID=A0A2R6C4Z8_9ARCH|nr:MAG: 50S ribosomal protein L19e [Candidatus Marsarchaeota G2 archaeon BE_D]